MQGEIQGALNLTLQGEKHLTGLQGKQEQGLQWHTLQQIQALKWQIGQQTQGNEWHL